LVGTTVSDEVRFLTWQWWFDSTCSYLAYCV